MEFRLFNNRRNAMIRLIGRIAAIAAFCVLQTAFASAADLNVYSSIGMRGALEELVPVFQKESGKTLALTWGTAAMLTKRIAAGEPADVAIVTRANIDSLNHDGKLTAGSDVTLANSSVALAVKSGKPKPDISTPEAFKDVLLKAKSIAYSNPASGGASGVYFATVLQRLGIAEEIKAKTKFPPEGGNTASLIISGEAELAIQQKPELMNAAGITANCKNADAATAFLKFLQSEEAKKVLEASGFDLK
jgi:molybdate transport system substrate-binding protein